MVGQNVPHRVTEGVHGLGLAVDRQFNGVVERRISRGTTN